MSTVRLNTIGGRRHVLSRAGLAGGSRGQAYFVGPQGSRGKLTYGYQRSEIPEGLDRSLESKLMTIDLRNGRRNVEDVPGFLLDVSVDGDDRFLGRQRNHALLGNSTAELLMDR